MTSDQIENRLRSAASAIRAVRNGESRDHLGEWHAQACENGALEIEKLIVDYITTKQERDAALTKLEQLRSLMLDGEAEKAYELLC